MSVADEITKLPNGGGARTELAVFRQMVGVLAEVNIGESTIQIPCDGFYPPQPGMSVRVQWVNGSPSVTGPAKPLSARGKITAPGSPKASVNIDGVVYSMFVAAGYTAAVGDDVAVNWQFEGGFISGKVAGYEPPKPPEPVIVPPRPFGDLVVRAENSGRYQSGAGWWGNDPWASESNNGAWVYGNRVRDSLAGASNIVADIYLPLVRELSGGSLALHDYGSLPGGAPSFHDVWTPPTRSGWVRLPDGWGAFLAAGGRGVGVVNGGYTIWLGTASDGMSGALRFSGIRQ